VRLEQPLGEPVVEEISLAVRDRSRAVAGADDTGSVRRIRRRALAPCGDAVVAQLLEHPVSTAALHGITILPS